MIKQLQISSSWSVAIESDDSLAFVGLCVLRLLTCLIQCQAVSQSVLGSSKRQSQYLFCCRWSNRGGVPLPLPELLCSTPTMAPSSGQTNLYLKLRHSLAPGRLHELTDRAVNSMTLSIWSNSPKADTGLIVKMVVKEIRRSITAGNDFSPTFQLWERNEELRQMFCYFKDRISTMKKCFNLINSNAAHAILGVYKYFLGTKITNWNLLIRGI